MPDHDYTPGGNEFERSDSEQLSETPSEAPLEPSLDASIEDAVANARANDLPFDDLTVSEAIAVFFQAPLNTWRAFRSLIRPRSDGSRTLLTVPLRPSSSAEVAVAPAPIRPSVPQTLSSHLGNGMLLQLGLYLIAFVLAWWGSGTMRLGDEAALSMGMLLFGIAAVIWVVGFLVGEQEFFIRWWRTRDRWLVPELAARAGALFLAVVGLFFLLDSMNESVLEAERILTLVAAGLLLLIVAGVAWLIIDVMFGRLRVAGQNDLSEEDASLGAAADSELQLPWYMRIHPARVLFFIGGVSFSALTWLGTSNNEFITITFYVWLVSIILWALALTPNVLGPWWWLRRKIAAVRHFHWRRHGLGLLLLIVIMVLGGALRLRELSTLPPEMTSDHVELLLDAVKLLDGQRQIFFANNGGRESFQMYLMALLSLAPGMGINHETLKTLAVIESLITIPVMVWLGRTIIGPERRRLGWYVGFILAALLATSYWHLTVTRLALRIILTPLIMSLIMIYFARALRFNQRADYILAGIALGFGLYMYQAIRMVPVLIVLVVLLAMYISARHWQDRLRYGMNLFVLAFISLIVFLPMLHYSLDQPEQFWRRTIGRLSGDDVVEETLPDGTIKPLDPTLGDYIESFTENVPQLMNNMRNALWMFQYKGDGAWINGVPGTPVLSIMVGAAFAVGLAAYGVLIVKTRDPVFIMVPIAVLIMLLPSALSIAFPHENPSNTRASGALPAVLLIAALPIALIAERIRALQSNRIGFVAALGFVGIVVGSAYYDASSVYFGKMRASYEQSTFNYSQVGQVMYGLALSGDVPYGNMFMIASPYWWDHRAVGLEAGIEGIWPNGVYDFNGDDDITAAVDYLPYFMRSADERTDRFAFSPSHNVEVFYSASDEVTPAKLQTWFPDGYATFYDNVYERRQFYRYTIPAIGQEGLEAFLAETIPEASETSE